MTHHNQHLQVKIFGQNYILCHTLRLSVPHVTERWERWRSGVVNAWRNWRLDSWDKSERRLWLMEEQVVAQRGWQGSFEFYLGGSGG